MNTHANNFELRLPELLTVFFAVQGLNPQQ